jgi:hypothetical protein
MTEVTRILSATLEATALVHEAYTRLVGSPAARTSTRWPVYEPS